MSDLQAFISDVIERVGQQPDSNDGTRCIWICGQGEIVLKVTRDTADIDAEFIVNPAAIDPSDTQRHRYQLTEFEDWNGRGDMDHTMYTYDRLVTAVAGVITSNLRLAAF